MQKRQERFDRLKQQVAAIRSTRALDDEPAAVSLKVSSQPSATSQCSFSLARFFWTDTLLSMDSQQLINGRYAPLQPLGEGGFGSVWLATDTITQRRVAVKMLINMSTEALERFKREGRLLVQSINNRHVVEILDHNFSHCPPYIVLEYCEGGTLRNWVGKSRPWTEIAAALMHVVNGLHGVHLVGGFHRDIKPENLLVSINPGGVSSTIKLGDFGLARTPVATRSPMTRSAAGTDGYIAPEILAGQPFTSNSDMYSLGIVATELLTGLPDSTQLGRVAMPPALRSLVRDMLSPSPNDRPTTQRAANVLNSLLQQKSPALVEQPVNRPSARPQGWGDLLLAGLLAGGVVAAIAALAGGDDADWDDNVQRRRGSDGRFRPS